jgi:hypothetical protein
MTLRSVTRVCLLLALCAAVGCSTTGRHRRSKKCDVCDSGTVYYFMDGTPATGMPAGPGTMSGPGTMPGGPAIPPAPGAAPAPILSPSPLPDSQLQPVPPPPTSDADRPAPFQAWRERTGEFFRNAGSNLRDRFSRDQTVVR